MLEKELLRLILCYDFYNDNKLTITEKMFSNELQPLFRLVVETHNKLKKDLTITEIKELYKVHHPTTTKAAWDNLCSILDDLPSEVSKDVASEVLKKAYLVDAARRLAEAGLQIVNGAEIEIAKITKIVEEIKTGNVSEAIELEAVTDDIGAILAQVDANAKWSYNIPLLKENCKGVGPGIFAAAFGRVETGKSAFAISLCAAAGGWASQGALIHYYCNEERAVRTKVRAVMAWTEMPILTLENNIEKAQKKYNKIKDNIKFFDTKGLDIEDYSKMLERDHPDIVVWDQLDKVSCRGIFAREDERLGALYIRARDILVEHNCAGLAISQANADAEGKTYMATTNMAQARTSKAAEVDVLIGIGKSPLHSDNGRILNIIKNKVTGNHEQVVCMLQPDISRYIG